MFVVLCMQNYIWNTKAPYVVIFAIQKNYVCHKNVRNFTNWFFGILLCIIPWLMTRWLESSLCFKSFEWHEILSKRYPQKEWWQSGTVDTLLSFISQGQGGGIDDGKSSGVWTNELNGLEYDI